MTVTWAEHAARLFEPPPGPRWAAPGDLAQELDPRTRQTPALRLLDEALVEAFNMPDSRLIVSIAPQEGKSQRISRWFPLWCLTQNPEMRIAIASYESAIARRWGRAIRDAVIQHTMTLGLQVRGDLSAQHEWELAGHIGGVYTTGIAGSLAGRPAELLVIDDPVKDRLQADSITYRDRAWDFWREVGGARLAPGAPVVVVSTRWHHDDLCGRLMAAEDGHLWRVINIPAEADHRPELGEVDLLGREPGEFLESSRGRTREQWEAIKVRVGPRTWASLYQGRPTPDAGGLFPREWARYTEPLWFERPDGSRIVPGHDFELAQSWDFAFKDKSDSDYVVGQVLLRRGAQVFLLDQVRARLSFTQSISAMLGMSARWPQAVAKFVEDKSNGPAIMNSLATHIAGLIPVEPKGSKYARAAAISPLAFSRDIVLPSADLLPNVEQLIEEAAGFPNWANDDMVDALSQGVNEMILKPLLMLGPVDADDLGVVDRDVSYLGGY